MPVPPSDAPISETPAPGQNRGRFQPGNRASLKHGAYAKRETLPATALVHAEAADAFRAQLVADQGGPDELTAVRSGYIGRLAEIETMLRLLGADLAARGIFTPRGRVRNTYTLFLQTVDRWDRLARVLGLDRRARNISESPIEWLDRVASEQPHDEPATADPDTA